MIKRRRAWFVPRLLLLSYLSSSRACASTSSSSSTSTSTSRASSFVVSCPTQGRGGQKNQNHHHEGTSSLVIVHLLGVGLGQQQQQQHQQRQRQQQRILLPTGPGRSRTRNVVGQLTERLNDSAGEEEDEKNYDVDDANNDDAQPRPVDARTTILTPVVMVDGNATATITTMTTATTDTDTATANDPSTTTLDTIFGLTAAMAKTRTTYTSLETTLRHIETAKLSDMPLIDAEGRRLTDMETDVAPLIQGRRLALYFGAGWCPQCRELEFMLPQYMSALEESGQPIQFIYVPSDHSIEFQLDRMVKSSWTLGVPYGDAAQQLKAKHRIWSGMESKDFADAGTERRSGVPAFVVLDTKGDELAFLNGERDTIAALGDWPLDDPNGIF